MDLPTGFMIASAVIIAGAAAISAVILRLSRNSS